MHLPHLSRDWKLPEEFLTPLTVFLQLKIYISFCVIFLLLHLLTVLDCNWVGVLAFSHPSLNVHSSSAIHTAAASMRTTEQVCSSARLCLTPMQQIDSNDALHQFAQNLVVFFISKQTVSQIDTDSDNAINQIFLQKCPNLMVFNDTNTLSAVPSLAYSVQLNAHPTCQPQPSRTAGTALTPASWTSRQSKNDTCKDSWDFYFPSFYYKLLWNILLGKTLMNRRWCGLKRRPTCSSNTPGSTISTHTPQTPSCTQDVKMGKCRAKRTMSHVFWDLVPK